MDIEEIFTEVIQDFSWINELPLDDDQKHELVSEISHYVFNKLKQ
jgi:hypothetical protein